MSRLTKREIEFLKNDHGFERIIQKKRGEIHADKNGKRIFVGWNADDVRYINPAMREALNPDSAW